MLLVQCWICHTQEGVSQQLMCGGGHIELLADHSPSMGSFIHETRLSYEWCQGRGGGRMRRRTFDATVVQPGGGGLTRGPGQVGGGRGCKLASVEEATRRLQR